MEIRLHGRGGQGGVTCAKILAAIYSHLGKSVQTFGDYAGERSGAPVRAYTRISDEPITNRNKVYEPDQLLVLDQTLLGADTVSGLADGGLLLVDFPGAPAELAEGLGRFRLATVDAKSIARRHGIGSRSLVIVNTTIAGAYVRVVDLPFETLERAYEDLGFASNVDAAREAYESVRVREPAATETGPAMETGARPAVVALVDHRASAPTGLQTGSWRTLVPRYVERPAPCNAWCPAGNDVVGFVQALAREGIRGAAERLGPTTPLASVCGRVCPAPCMEGCNRAELDGAVDIRALERFVGDGAPVAIAERTDPGRGHRVAIVGGGPAGLSAAYALALAGCSATIFESEAELGGVLRTGIPTYRLPRDVLDREIDGILSLGVTARLGERMDATALLGLSRDFDALILATGLQRLRALDVPGADLAGVEQGIRYLHRVNLEGGAKLEGHIVVLGGGNTAMDCARSAIRSGAEKVTVTYRRTRLEMPAITEEIVEAEEEGVELLFQRQPLAFHGEDRVVAVELAEVEMGEPDENGRRRPVTTERSSRLACDGVLLALGQSADTSFLPPGWELEDGRVVEGGGPLNVFAAGDLATGDGTVTHAIGDGRRAAGLALEALGEAVEVFERADRGEAVSVLEMRLDRFERVEPAARRHAPAGARAHSFDEVNLGLGDAEEAKRCFSCGHCTDCDTCLVFCPEGIILRRRPALGSQDYEIDLAYCKGCGICVTECPRSAMEMVPT